MDSKRVTRARKMNTAEQENEIPVNAPTSRSSETDTSRRPLRHGPLATKKRNQSPTQDVNIDILNRNVNAARQRKRAALLAQLEFEKLETERIVAKAVAAHTKMLLLRLVAAEEDTGKDTDEPELIMLSNFLNKIADQCSASVSIDKGANRNSKPAPKRRPCKTNAINIIKYDNKNTNSHTAFQSSNRSSIIGVELYRNKLKQSRYPACRLLEPTVPAPRECCSSPSRPVNTTHHLRPSDTSNDQLNNIVKQHIDIESLDVTPHKPSHDPAERALALLGSDSVRLTSGQFETRLLWKLDS
ncbi:hypothetical protein EVAR_46500_1 [Eumeta japonica]|uniref:Uncharacterized protein n=1 Tax=Eumeta variegata TaxID=151549 RepID=A0A4C1WVP4_EUMVA|nr:hypothetical protein EVAR_46500_1 [Eumeta japonica]